MKKSLKMLICINMLFVSLCSTSIKADVITLADYLVPASTGTSWTYRVTVDGDMGPIGTEFTVTEPWYNGIESMFPVTANTGDVVFFEPGINLYFDIIPSVTVEAGTFTDVLLMVALDENFSANSVNTELGIDASINQGVTDVEWFAPDVGIIGFLGVRAENGTFDGGHELISYSTSAVPVPAAAWLFFSGLLGLIGIARRKKA